MKRVPTGTQGVYSYQLEDGTTRYGAVVDVRGAWGKKRTQRRKEGFHKLREAKAWRVAELASVLRGDAASGGDNTFGWWVREWLQLREGDLEWGTLQLYRLWLGKFAAFNDVPLRKVTPVEVETALVAMRRVYAWSTVNRMRAVLSACFNAAVNLGMIPRNPVQGTSVGKKDRAAKNYWDEATVRRLLDATKDDERWGVVWRLLAETWMRVGEACGLRWGDIDFAAKTIRIERTMRVGEGGWVVGSTAKTRASVRTVPMSDTLAAMLLATRDRRRFRGVQGLVLDTNPGIVRTALEDACARIGVDAVGPHMLRHAGATMAIRAGIGERIVQQRLGHTNVGFTLSVYVHPNEDDHRRAGDVVAALLDVV